ARWPTFAQWSTAVGEAVAALEAGGDYYARAESAAPTAGRVRQVFLYDPNAGLWWGAFGGCEGGGWGLRRGPGASADARGFESGRRSAGCGHKRSAARSG